MAGLFREQVVKRLTRSRHWPKVRRIHLGLFPSCMNCGKKRKKSLMQVHHIVPFSVDPTKELHNSNLLTLCSNPRCHLDKGHFGYWRSWNVNVVEDCKIWLQKYLTRPLK